MKHSGFTLIEVLVSLSLMGIVAACLSPAFVAQMKQNTSSELKSLAIDATDRQVDTMRLIDPATMPRTGSATFSIPVGGKTFSVKVEYCPTSTFCSNVTRDLKFTTSYRGATYYATETVFTQLR